MRLDRYASALERKSPKLVRAARTEGRSVLVLEDIDSALSGLHVVQAKLPLAASRIEGLALPSEVVLVQDIGAVTLRLILIRENGEWLDPAIALPLTPADVDPARPILRRRYA
jgi:hypothetical protein